MFIISDEDADTTRAKAKNLASYLRNSIKNGRNLSPADVANTLAERRSGLSYTATVPMHWAEFPFTCAAGFATCRGMLVPLTLPSSGGSVWATIFQNEVQCLLSWGLVKTVVHYALQP